LTLVADSQPFWPQTWSTFLRNYIFGPPINTETEEGRRRVLEPIPPRSAENHLPSSHWSRCQRQSGEADKPQGIKNKKKKNKKKKKKFRNPT